MVKGFRKLIPLLLILFSLKIYAQSIEVHAFTDTTNYLIGDYIHYKVQLKYDKSLKVFFPSVEDSIKSLTFIEQKPVIRQDNNGEIIEIHNYVFSKYDSGKVTIPSISIPYSSSNGKIKSIVKTNKIELTVKTLPVNMKDKIQDVKPPLKINFNWLFVIIIALIIIALLFAAYFAYNYYKKKHKVKTKIIERIIIPPHKTALKQLNELEEKKLWQQGKVKEYHSEITNIIRTYFENRFNFIAMEMPSSEVLDELKKIKEAEPIFEITHKFFNNADLVKFAKFKPMPSVNEEMMKQAYNIVRQTKSDEETIVKKEVVNV